MGSQFHRLLEAIDSEPVDAPVTNAHLRMFACAMQEGFEEMADTLSAIRMQLEFDRARRHTDPP